jgi:sugar/nucleoside kinase (ribokinase family)
MAAPQYDVVGVGVNSVDYVTVVPQFPSPAGPLSKMRLRAYEVRVGGQTATAMAACASLGLRAAYIGAVGDDLNGTLVRAALDDAHVAAAHIEVKGAATRFAVILLDERTGERAVLWDFDERLKLRDEQVRRDLLERARVVHVDDVDVRAAVAAARVARGARVPVTSDIDHVSEDTGDLLDAVSVAIFAEHVPEELAAFLAGRQPRPATSLMDSRGRRADSHDLSTRVLREALAQLPRRHDQTLVVTRGNQGALALDDSGFHEAPGLRVTAVDTTGAGDVFRAGFIYGLLNEWPLGERLRFANAAAAVSCTRLGAMASVPTLAEVEELMARGEWGESVQPTRPIHPT